MKACGTVHKYGDNVDTDVIIPARYLNSSDPAELAKNCMEDIDPDFVKRVKKGDIMVANKNFGCGSSREHAPIAIKASYSSVEANCCKPKGISRAPGTRISVISSSTTPKRARSAKQAFKRPSPAYSLKRD